MENEDLRSKLDSHFRVEFGASFSDLLESETRLVTTPRREAKRFAGYLLPVWFARQGDKCIISVSPELQSSAETAFDRLVAEDIFSCEGLSKAADLGEAVKGSLWNHGPYFYNTPQAFKPSRLYEVVELKASDKGVFLEHADWFGLFNGYWNESRRKTRVFTIFESGIPVSTTYTMANSASAWQYAVWTRKEYRRRGYGKAVVSAAVEETLKCGKLPLYSTSWENIASRTLAESLGFQFYCENYAIKIPDQCAEERPDRPTIDW